MKPGQQRDLLLALRAARCLRRRAHRAIRSNAETELVRLHRHAVELEREIVSAIKRLSDVDQAKDRAVLVEAIGGAS